MSILTHCLVLGALAITLLPSAAVARAKGDLSPTPDGVDIGDLPLLARHLGGLLAEPLTAEQLAAADVAPTSMRGDGWVDSADLLVLARHLFLGVDVDADGLLGEGLSSPFLADTDGDALCDGGPVSGVCAGGESALGTNPLTADTDADGLCDGPFRQTPIPTFTGTCQAGEDLDENGSSASETSPTLADTDSDGLCDGPDHGDLIVPGPGPVPVAVICTRGEDLNADASLSGTETDPKDPDSDNDLTLDGDETDSDGDGRSDRRETLYETLALDPDTDNDGICDGSFPGVLAGCSGAEDPNGNGSVELSETDPRNADTDGDLLADGTERSLGSDPRKTDSDGDYISDGAEVAAGTSPLLTDTDGDGLADGVEVALSSDPLDPQSGEADGYGSLRSYGGDTHVHSGSPAGAYAQSLSSWDPNCFDCPSVWCERMYSFARQAGYDWVVSTNHEGNLPSYYQPGDPIGGLAMTPEILAWWKSVGLNYSNPAHPQDVYPTHPDGFPLYDGSGGHTDDQIESLVSCADGATEEGRFVGFFGIEYTAAPATESGCSTAAVGCGGHKTVIFPRARNEALGEQSCGGVSSSWPYDDQCNTLGELYDAVAANGGVVHVAHPNFGPKPGLEPFAVTPTSDNGGIDPTLVVGAEYRGSQPELTPGLQHTYSSGVEPPGGLNVGGILARGYRLHPTFGSDKHFTPYATSFQSAGQATECWAEDLTKADLLDAMRDHRCYFARDEIQVRLSVENTIMGSSTTSDNVNPQVGVRVRLFARAKSTQQNLGINRWYLMRGTVEDPIVAPAQVALPSAVGNCHPSNGASAQQLCIKDIDVTLPGATTAADYEGFYYVILRRGTTEVAVTAPVWIDPPATP